MLTVDALLCLGANTKEGLARCMNNEEFYLRVVKLGLTDKNFDRLRDAIETGNLDEAFEAAHALKGVLSNLALTSLLEPVCELTEHLRAREELDYTPAVRAILEKKLAFSKLLD